MAWTAESTPLTGGRRQGSGRNGIVQNFILIFIFAKNIDRRTGRVSEN
jgi:hypothetical protein